MRKPKRPELTAADIVVGRSYRAKRPRKDLFGNIINDREVLYINPVAKLVQYDSDALPMGRHYPMVKMEEFIKWASHQLD